MKRGKWPEIPIPFDGNGDQLHYPNPEYAGNLRPTVWADNAVFTDVLTYGGHGRGRSAVYFKFKRQDGRQVYVFLKDLQALVPHMHQGQVWGRFVFCKRGQNYGCRLWEPAGAPVVTWDTEGLPALPSNWAWLPGGRGPYVRSEVTGVDLDSDGDLELDLDGESAYVPMPVLVAFLRARGYRVATPGCVRGLPCAEALAMFPHRPSTRLTLVFPMRQVVQRG